MSRSRLLQYLVVGGCLLWIVGSVFYYGMYERFMKDGGDAWGYYIYLPSTFVSGDLTSLEYIAKVREGFNQWSIDKNANHLGIGEVNIAPNVKPVIKYTSGVAVMLTPFFLLAHALAGFLGYEADGFNPIYWLSIYFGVIVWVLLGMVMLYRTLIRYVSRHVALITLALIAVGSNLYYFMAYNSPMSHAPLFALYCLLIYFSDRFYREQKMILALGIGLVCGMITVIRPVELICIFIPLLWQIDSLKNRWHFIRTHYSAYLLAALGFAVSVMPQLLYWKVTTGEWLFYSYGEEGFDFTNPKIWKGLTGFMNGWLVYTPLFLLAIPGMRYLYLRHKGIFVPLVLFMILHVYIVFSWHNWYYINSFGSRPMVETYALMAFPLALTFQHVQKSWWKYVLGVLCVFFVLLNQHQIWQVSKGMLSTEEGNAAYYWAIFGKSKMTEEILISADTQLRQPDRNDLDSVGVIWAYHTSVGDSLNTEQLLAKHSGPSFEVVLTDAPIRPGDYLRISVQAKSSGWNNNRWGMATITSYFKHEDQPYRWRWNRINDKLGNPTWNLYGGEPDKWGEAWYFYKVPRQYQAGDALHVYLENQSHLDMFFHSFQIEKWVKQ